MKYPLMRNNIGREDLDAVIRHLQADDPKLTNGPLVAEFERAWSAWLGCDYSVFVNSGSSANLLSMAVLKSQHPDGGEVIVPPLTWVSDIASVVQNGFTPVFADINSETLSLDTAEVVKKITNETKAVFITHAQGFNGLTDELLKVLDDKDIPLIEDVCESHGAKHNGVKVGTFGLMSNFSFYYAHHMSTIEGGMICTNDHSVYQKLRMLRSHGLVRESDDIMTKNIFISNNKQLNPEFIFAYPAYNVRNTEIGAIIGLSQLKRLDENIEKRTQNFLHFLGLIDPKKYRTDFKVEGSSNYAFNLVLRQPDHGFAERLMSKMQDEGIEYRRGSAGGGNQLRQPYLKDIISSDYHLEFPEVEHMHFFGFYLGNYPSLGAGEIKDICSVLNAVE
jgi:CDP-6-deoxy-D-xylo-4-hexulose-3-dehydrase